MKIGVPAETRAAETRVALTPAAAGKFIKKGVEVCVARGAGLPADYPDAEYEAAGATLGSSEQAFAADVVLKVRAPEGDEIQQMRRGAMVVGLLDPLGTPEVLAQLAEAGLDALALELVPRISRAQSMDVLSSQANIAGYRAVLEATRHYRRFLPLMMTSAGTAKPARLVVLGVGVAGLQAIATAKRLGARVEAFDVRPETREQVLSLGAKFIDIDIGASGSGEGGYARELTAEERDRQQAGLAEHLAKADIIITTAMVPGRKAPELVPESVVENMRPGSVIVDLAAASGGNCPLSVADDVVVRYGVTLAGPTNLPGRMAADASSFYANNVYNLLELFIASGEEGAAPQLSFDLDDEIVNAVLTVHQGQVRFGRDG